MNFSASGEEIVVCAPLRTAIGTFGGALRETPATDLGATVAQEVLSRAGISGDQVDQAIIGNVLAAGQGMNPGRQVVIKSGIPVGVPGMTVNRVCGSGLQAVVSAAQEILMGDSEVILAGGIENMDMAPFLLPKGRYGYRMGRPSAEIQDHMVYDGLWDIFNDYHMGTTAENVARDFAITREEQDAYAVRSHQRAAEASKMEYFEGQIVPVEVKQRRETVQFVTDEHVRADASEEKMAKLKPAFTKDGTVTAGNASGINDGASLMLVTTARKAEELGMPVAARLVSYGVAGVDPSVMGVGMVPATRKALKGAGISVDDVELFEVNEAFASVAVAVGKEMEIPDEKLNPLGGAVALGHPIGASGAVLTTKLVHELARRQARYGVVTLCIGGGMGIAAVFENAA